MNSTLDLNGITINYETVGANGPWVALSPGGRRGMDAVCSLGNRIAAAGFRVLLHDRRNCGASDVSLEGDGAEHEIWADDLCELLVRLKAAPAYIGGSSSGCRMSIALALRHSEAVRGLLLWRITGGADGARRLAEEYYPLTSPRQKKAAWLQYAIPSTSASASRSSQRTARGSLPWTRFASFQS
jgi:pimeloyl-ACP methyl ester carboxylesterase